MIPLYRRNGNPGETRVNAKPRAYREATRHGSRVTEPGWACRSSVATPRPSEGEAMRTTLRLLAAAAVTLVLLSTGAAAPAASAAEPGVESQFVAGVNAVRADAGLPPLAVDGELTAVARAWADQMASENRISHNPNLGRQVSAPWMKLGENVGIGMRRRRRHAGLRQQRRPTTATSSTPTSTTSASASPAAPTGACTPPTSSWISTAALRRRRRLRLPSRRRLPAPAPAAAQAPTPSAPDVAVEEPAAPRPRPPRRPPRTRAGRSPCWSSSGASTAACAEPHRLHRAALPSRTPGTLR